MSRETKQQDANTPQRDAAGVGQRHAQHVRLVGARPDAGADLTPRDPVQLAAWRRLWRKLLAPVPDPEPETESSA